MSKFLSVLFMFLSFLVFTPITHAQVIESTPRVILGGTGGQEFGNTYLGALIAVEIPLKHFEIDISNTADLYASHVALGKGYANQTSVHGIYWLHTLGFMSGVNYSMYRVDIFKQAEYATGGLVLRKNIGGVPSRVFFVYTRQVNNGISPNTIFGTETSRLQAGAVKLEARMQCSQTGRSCLRFSSSFDVGVVKNRELYSSLP